MMQYDPATTMPLLESDVVFLLAGCFVFVLDISFTILNRSPILVTLHYILLQSLARLLIQKQLHCWSFQQFFNCIQCTCLVTVPYQSSIVGFLVTVSSLWWSVAMWDILVIVVNFYYGMLWSAFVISHQGILTTCTYTCIYLSVYMSSCA